MPDTNKLVPLVDAEDQGAEMLSPAARGGETGDHPLLGHLRLYLQPLPAAAADLVDALRLLGDDSLQPLCLGGLKKEDPILADMITKADFRGGGEDLFQHFFPPQQRETGEIVSLEVEEIEGIIEKVAAAGFPVIL